MKAKHKLQTENDTNKLQTENDKKLGNKMKKSEGKDTYKRCMISTTMKKHLDWGSETNDLERGKLN